MFGSRMRDCWSSLPAQYWLRLLGYQPGDVFFSGSVHPGASGGAGLHQRGVQGGPDLRERERRRPDLREHEL